VATGLKDLLQRARSRAREIAAAEAAELMKSGDGTLFLDVRESEELAEGKIPEALHIPRGLLEPRAAQDSPARAPEFSDLDRTVIVYCASGVRSILAAESLQALGFSDARSLAGGFAAWKREGHLVE